MSDTNTSDKSTENPNDIGKQFMLAHFSEMNQDLRHYDQRIETVLNIYAATWALLFAGTAALYNETKDLQLLFQVSGIPSLILFALGFFTVRRVVNSTISRDRRRAAANLAQHYFTLHAPEISPYLITFGHTPKLLTSVLQRPKYRGEEYEVSFPNGIVYFIVVLNSLLAGLAVASLADWIFKAERLWLLFFIIVATALALRLYAYNKDKNKHLLKKK